MEYTGKYLVTRLMHMRPCGDVYGFVTDSKKQCNGLEFKVSFNGSEIDCTSYMKLIMFGAVLTDKEITITTSGDYKESILKDYNQRLGKLFIEE